mmetsp:Transcript_12275/g.10877  ORF Transcript_12275/g.10877 Transcript_12275/m.10877 type:complete len:326 (+) Transcript_12275:22-999(+)
MEKILDKNIKEEIINLSDVSEGQEELIDDKNQNVKPGIKKRRFRQKEYSKENRRRKKQYVKELEEKCEKLEKVVDKLNYELWEMKNSNLAFASGLTPDATDMKKKEGELRAFVRNAREKQIPIKLEDITEAIHTISPAGDGRIQQLKYHFKAIIECIFMKPETLVFHIAHNVSDIPKKAYSQLLKDPKPKALDKLLTKGFSEGDKELYHAQMSPEFREKIYEISPKVRECFAESKSAVHDLIKARRKMLNSLKSLDPYFLKLVKLGFQQEEMLKFLEYFDKVENDPKYDFLNLFEVEKVKKDQVPETDAYMTEDDYLSVVNFLNE